MHISVIIFRHLFKAIFVIIFFIEVFIVGSSSHIRNEYCFSLILSTLSVLKYFLPAILLNSFIEAFALPSISFCLKN